LLLVVTVALCGPTATPTRSATPRLTEDLLAELDDLHRHLDTLPVIERPKGILIGYFGIDEDAAFCVVRRWCSHQQHQAEGYQSARSQCRQRPTEGPGQLEGASVVPFSSLPSH
jgi:hypothetical protein